MNKLKEITEMIEGVLPKDNDFRSIDVFFIGLLYDEGKLSIEDIAKIYKCDEEKIRNQLGILNLI